MDEAIVNYDCNLCTNIYLWPFLRDHNLMFFRQIVLDVYFHLGMNLELPIWHLWKPLRHVHYYPHSPKYRIEIPHLKVIKYARQGFFSEPEMLNVLQQRFHYRFTCKYVQLRSYETAARPVYEGKWVLFKVVWCRIKVQLCPRPVEGSRPLLTTFKWGTV